jgi:acylphosphatase
MLVARRWVIRGRVQGVGFRYFVLEAARVEGLSGWVRNRPDGHVEVRAQGDREAVDRFDHQIRRGPTHARIDGVEVEADLPSERETGFDVR